MRRASSTSGARLSASSSDDRKSAGAGGPGASQPSALHRLRLTYPPHLLPRHPIVVGRQRYEAMLRKRGLLARAGEQRQQSRQMRKMAGDENIALLSTKSVCDPLRWIVRLKIPCCRQRCQRIAGTPERLSGLFRAQLPAVPDHGRARAAGSRLGRNPLHMPAAVRRERPLRIDFGADRVAVVHQVKSHTRPFRIRDEGSGIPLPSGLFVAWGGRCVAPDIGVPCWSWRNTAA
jgi:hypothetical protein